MGSYLSIDLLPEKIPDLVQVEKMNDQFRKQKQRAHVDFW